MKCLVFGLQTWNQHQGSTNLCRRFLLLVHQQSGRLLLWFLTLRRWQGSFALRWGWSGPVWGFWYRFLVHGRGFLPCAEESSSYKDLRFGLQATERDGDRFLVLWLGAAGGSRGCRGGRRFRADTVRLNGATIAKNVWGNWWLKTTCQETRTQRHLWLVQLIWKQTCCWV